MAEVSIKKDQMVFRFTNLASVYGPFKFYLSNATNQWTVESEDIYQRYAANRKWVEASFDVKLAEFAMNWIAVTVRPSEEIFLESGRF